MAESARRAAYDAALVDDGPIVLGEPRRTTRGLRFFSAQGATKAFAQLLGEADIRIDGDRPWDISINHPKAAELILARGSLGLGESYMLGWWDCQQLDEFIARPACRAS